ncbi:MAG TPA: hypothetical protein EYG86_04165 [Crocinitomicaceae bacterium]|nr:hypothetical protein [Crocinitomicaceae bacterium]
MSEDTITPQVEEIAPKKKSKRKIILIISFLLLLIVSGYVYYQYYFVYSEGTRVGILYKFSKKGTFFKTYEGEMVLPGIKSTGSAAGLSTNRFQFSVSDSELAKKLMESQGMELELHYSNYNNSLPWRGDNYSEEEGQYVVDKLIKVKDENPNGYGL